MADDQTFSGTIAGIDRLRNSRQSDDDWREWKRSLIDAAEAGAALERKVTELDFTVRGSAKQGALDRLVAKVAMLEAKDRRRGNWVMKVLQGLWLLLLAVFTFALGRIWS